MKRWILVGVLALGALGYTAVPNGALSDGYYVLIAAAMLGAAVLGLHAHRPRRIGIWTVFLAGIALRLAGDIAWSILRSVLHVEPFPSVADFLYLASYPLVIVGLAMMVRARRPGHDRVATLDAAIVAVGAAILAGVFIIAPTIADTTQGLFARSVSTAYPVADLALLAVLARLWTTSGSVLRSYRYLGLGMLLVFAGDIGYDAFYITVGSEPSGPWFDLAYLLGYLCVAAAVLDPSMRSMTEPGSGAEDSFTRGRLAVLTIASMLAPTALVVEGLRGRPLHWQIIGPGAILLSGLVLGRLSGLLQQVQQQAAQLNKLARIDGLTGIPNRRTWDYELRRAMDEARSDGTALCVAMLDLDHFKAFNDTYGHPAGDALLQETTTAWRSALPDDAFLARYGGEEFAVLLRGRTLAQAYAELDVLRGVTPLQQAFSGGLARWDGDEDPAALVSRADAQLYDAKRGGRARILPVAVPDNITEDKEAAARRYAAGA
jgi:diguanylate cyclase (GGDEF)-like protein